MCPEQPSIAQKNVNSSKDQFFEWVRDALKSLYDSHYLETHPLVDVLVPTENRTARQSQDLRKVLVAAIQQMKPARENPPDSRDWRSYQILEQRFIAGQTTAEVQQALNISRSLLFQEQAYALQTLVDRLWAQTITHEMGSLPVEPELIESQTDAQQTPDTEILRLLEEATWEVVDLNALILNLSPMLSAIGAEKGINLSYEVDSPVTIPKGNRVLLRMMLMGLVGDLVNISGISRINLRTFKNPELAGVHITPEFHNINKKQPEKQPVHRFSIMTYNRILHAMRAELLDNDGVLGPQSLVWKLIAHQQILLLVDDHPGIEALFSRYLSGSNWRLVAASSGETARELLLSITPDVIFLDVILPQQDGWELLQQFRADEKTREIPVIVCSVIHEPQLLETLGASGYLSKPVSQTELYRILRQVT